MPGLARCLGSALSGRTRLALEAVGSRHKARDWLEQAAKLAPGYPDNQFNLIESYWQWKDHEAASNALQQLDSLWPAAAGPISPAKPGNKTVPTGPPGVTPPEKDTASRPGENVHEKIPKTEIWAAALWGNG